MAAKQIEILPCLKCKNVPVFVPLPSADFPINFIALCTCSKSRIHSRLALGRQVYKRRAAVNPFIKRWNKRNTVTDEYAPIISISAGKPAVTCKFCGCSGLYWHRRPYKSPWKSYVDYVLYERVFRPNASLVTHNGQAVNARAYTRAYKLHKCLARKSILKIEYIKE